MTDSDLQVEEPECIEVTSCEIIREKSCNTVNFPIDTSKPLIIFDWDDTLFPSSWIVETFADPETITQEHIDALHDVELQAIQVIRLAKSLGNTIIITNAENSWVDLSAKSFFPSFFEELSDICVESARSTYESANVTTPEEWKGNAFKDIITSFTDLYLGTEVKCHVLSIGDSMYEREALLSCRNIASNLIVKSVKLLDTPCSLELSTQLKLVHSALPYLVSCTQNQDLKLCIKQKVEG